MTTSMQAANWTGKLYEPTFISYVKVSNDLESYYTYLTDYQVFVSNQTEDFS